MFNYTAINITSESYYKALCEGVLNLSEDFVKEHGLQIIDLFKYDLPPYFGVNVSMPCWLNVIKRVEDFTRRIDLFNTFLNTYYVKPVRPLEEYSACAKDVIDLILTCKPIKTTYSIYASKQTAIINVLQNPKVDFGLLLTPKVLLTYLDVLSKQGLLLELLSNSKVTLSLDVALKILAAIPSNLKAATFGLLLSKTEFTEDILYSYMDCYNDLGISIALFSYQKLSLAFIQKFIDTYKNTIVCECFEYLCEYQQLTSEFVIKNRKALKKYLFKLISNPYIAELDKLKIQLLFE